MKLPRVRFKFIYDQRNRFTVSASKPFYLPHIVMFLRISQKKVVFWLPSLWGQEE